MAQNIPTGVPIGTKQPLKRHVTFAEQVAGFNAAAATTAQAPAKKPVEPILQPVNGSKEELEALTAEIQAQLNAPTPGAPAVEVKEVEVETDEEDTTSKSGAVVQHTNCPHCGWDMALPDIIPTIDDKRAFKIAMEGMIPFAKAYQIFGDMAVAFRELQIFEVDACFEQLKRDNASDVMEMSERWQALFRYRLVLQMRQVQSGQLVVDLPDGLNRVLTPMAKLTWDEYFESKAASIPAMFNDATIPLIKRVSQYVIGNHLGNEARFRAVSTKCNEFQRLVSKLEAMKDSPDFW